MRGGTKHLPGKHSPFLRSIWLFGVVAIVLIASTACILFRLYTTSSMLAAANEQDFLQLGKEKAGVVNEYLRQTSQRLDVLAGSGAFHTYYHNKDLGMSLQYGLAVALTELSNELRRFKTTVQDDGRPVFSHIAFFDLQEARIIARTDSEGFQWLDESLIKKFEQTHRSRMGFGTVCNGNSCEVFTLLAVNYKKETKGYLVTVWNLDRIGERIQLKSLQRADDFAGLADSIGTLILGPREMVGKNVSELFGAPIATSSTFQVIGVEESQGAIQRQSSLVAGASLSKTGLSLIIVAPKSAFFPGHPLSLWTILFVTLIGAFVLMLGYVFLSFMDRYRMYQALEAAHEDLEVRVEQRTAALAKANTALGREVKQRKDAEEALQKAHGELEIRVHERTAELLKANEQFQREATDRRQAEETLRESEQRFRELAELLPVFIFEFDAGLRFTFVNRAGLELGGYTWEEASALKVPEVIAPEDLEKVARDISRAMSGESVNAAHYTLVKKDGTTALIETWSIPIVRENKPVGVRGVGVDITERKKAQDQINESLREKEVLLREIHHRVKNNLAVIIGLLKLQSRFASEEVREMFSEVKDRVHAMATAHEKLYESDNLATLDVQDYVGSLLDHLFTSYKSLTTVTSLKKDIQNISLGIDTAIPLGMLLTELVSNCLKHAFPEKQRGEVRVRLRCVGEREYELIVGDDGVGIPPSVDFKNPASLGLDLVQAFVRQLNGKTEIIVANGTEVRLRFIEKPKRSIPA